MKRLALSSAIFLLAACNQVENRILYPELVFSTREGVGLTAPRDLTVDRFGNVFVFDYDDYQILGFDSAGTLLADFGGWALEDGDFQHLMAVEVFGDSLVALDAGAVSVFDLDGQLRAKRSYADTIICDLPRIHPSGVWAGDWIVEETAENILTLRDPDGSARARVAGYSLGELFPGVEPGGMFFINRTEALSYHYDFLPDGRLVWAASDRLEVLVRDGGQDAVLYSSPATPIPYPAETIEAMLEEQANLGPPLFMNVPEQYQLIQHLFVDETGDPWVYILSGERTGLLHLSEEGRELGFYQVEAEFDVPAARVTAANGKLYFLVADRIETGVYVVDRP